MKEWLSKLRNFITPRWRKNAKAVDAMEMSEDDHIAWWGNFLVTEQQSRYVKVGGIILCLDHYDNEWQIACHSEYESKHFPARSIKINNHASEISLKPVLPDRPVLSRLERPLILPPSSEITLYSGIPCWIRLEIGKPALVLDEFPTKIMSDSWYGFNTLMGELCYGGPTIFLKPDELLLDNTLILTRITAANPTRETILLNEIRLPLPQLSVYHDARNHLWTENVLMLFEDHIPMTTILKIASSQKDLQVLSRSRHKIKRRFPRLFGV